MKLLKNLYLLFLCLIFFKSHSQSCDTNKYLKDIIYRQFGGSPLDYKYIEIQNYKNCINVDTLKKLILDLVADKRKIEYVAHILKAEYWKRESFYNQIKGCAKDTLCRNRKADSLALIKNKAIAIDNLNWNVSDFLIELCEFYKIKESIPILKDALVKPKPNHYDKQTIEMIKLALCRLGDSLYVKRYITKLDTMKYGFDNLSSNDRYSIYYIGYYVDRQEGYYLLSKKLISKEYRMDSEEEYKEYFRNHLLEDLCLKVKNPEFIDLAYNLYKKYNPEMYELLKSKKSISFRYKCKIISDKEIKIIIDWFKKNKGKYIFS